ncbi:hypothetical protein Scep_024253 [Stephania cephalantha]|uniref:Uncharacterized protein n=1 Tax=Stephania cephalantha TaxID=152367 RepID=A0AAP0F3C3_9MAGN
MERSWQAISVIIEEGPSRGNGNQLTEEDYDIVDHTKRVSNHSRCSSSSSKSYDSDFKSMEPQLKEEGTEEGLRGDKAEIQHVHPVIPSGAQDVEIEMHVIVELFSTLDVEGITLSPINLECNSSLNHEPQLEQEGGVTHSVESEAHIDLRVAKLEAEHL